MNLITNKKKFKIELKLILKTQIMQEKDKIYKFNKI